MVKIRAYPKYKNSKELWLGEVPEHWVLKRTKRLLRERVQKGFPDEPLLAATQTKGVVRKEQYENRTVLALKDLHFLKLVRVGDFVISLRSFQGGIEYAREQGIISPAYTVLYPIQQEMHGFFAWLFKSKPYIENLRLHVTGIRQGQNIDYEKLGRSEIPIPPFFEQDAIVQFLSHVDRRIRQYILEKQKIIKLLNEQKQELINKAITRGIDPNVRLKPSGINWLGEIPDHWKVLPLKRVAWFKGGCGFPHNFQGEKNLEIPFFKVSDMTLDGNDVLMKSHNNSISREVARELGATVFLEDTIIFPKVGGAMLTNKRRITTKPSCIDNNMMGCVITKNIALDFLFLKLSQIDLGLMSKPGPVPAISEGEVREIRIPVPPTDEQAEIVRYVQKNTESFDRVISFCKHEIDLIREYRTRLISDAVTGKMDVRDIKLPEIEDINEKEPIDEQEILEDVEDTEEVVNADE